MKGLQDSAGKEWTRPSHLQPTVDLPELWTSLPSLYSASTRIPMNASSEINPRLWFRLRSRPSITSTQTGWPLSEADISQVVVTVRLSTGIERDAYPTRVPDTVGVNPNTWPFLQQMTRWIMRGIFNGHLEPEMNRFASTYEGTTEGRALSILHDRLSALITPRSLMYMGTREHLDLAVELTARDVDEPQASRWPTSDLGAALRSLPQDWASSILFLPDGSAPFPHYTISRSGSRYIPHPDNQTIALVLPGWAASSVASAWHPVHPLFAQFTVNDMQQRFHTMAGAWSRDQHKSLQDVYEDDDFCKTFAHDCLTRYQTVAPTLHIWPVREGQSLTAVEYNNLSRNQFSLFAPEPYTLTEESRSWDATETVATRKVSLWLTPALPHDPNPLPLPEDGGGLPI